MSAPEMGDPLVEEARRRITRDRLRGEVIADIQAIVLNDDPDAAVAVLASVREALGRLS